MTDYLPKDSIQELSCEAVELLKGMIRIPAPSTKEEKKSRYIRSWIKAKCNDVRIIGIKNNLVLLPPHIDRKKETLWICSHMDTVPPAAGYTYDPYGATQEGEKIIGLGSNDDGASLVAQVVTFLHLCYGLYKSNGSSGVSDYLPVNIVEIISAEEESCGSKGIALVINEIKRKHPELNPDYAIIGEPTKMNPAVAERGLLVIDATAQGRSAHAARNEGINAIYIALRDIERIVNYNFRRVSKVLGKVKATVTQINAGRAHNVIPEECSYVIDVRPTERYDNREIVRLLQKRVESTLVARSTEHKASITPKEHLLMETIQKLRLSPYISPTTSDWTRLSVPAIKMGPGDSARSHGADEYILTEEIANGIRGYIEFIKCLKRREQ